MMFGVLPRSSGPLARKLAARHDLVPDNRVSLSLERADRAARRAMKRLPEIKDRRRFYHTVALIRASNGRTPIDILRRVATEHNLTLDEMRSPQRFTHLVRARQEAAYRIAKETTASLPKIGQLMHRDHTTILHSITRYAAMHNLPHPRG